MKCKKCQNEMKKDDVDFNFKGCYDVYWICEHCKMSCREKVRYGKTCKVEWQESEE